MCGIYGITGIEKSKINKMINICSHRGPDGHNIYSNTKITFGHNLLSITSQPSDGEQPWFDDGNQNVLVFNGEIFNYQELKKKFHNLFIPKTSCDTELLYWLLNNFSYEEVICNLIDSMHAFAFYNSKDNQIVLSRDHAGIKPLYFSLGTGGIIFASEIKALIDFVYNSRKVNRTALALTSVLGSIPTRDTLFTGIYKVLPGETIVYDINEKNINSSFRDIIKPNSNTRFNSEKFSLLTKRIIKNSTLGNRQFGVFLSGGIDSTLISYELQKIINNLSTFTNYMEPNEIINGEDHNGDANIAKKLSEDFNFNHHEIKITPEIIAENFDNSIKFIEEPTYNWNQPMYYYTNKVLSDNGVTITMAGDIGDEILGGYQKYFAFLKSQDKIKSWSEFLGFWMNKYSQPLKLNLQFNENDIKEILLKSLPIELWNENDVANTAMALDCITTVPEDFFKRNDKYGMAFSMEGRFPLSSKQLMKYCLNIHSKEKFADQFHNGNKMMVRNTYINQIPDYVFYKEKTGWSVPVTKWIQEDNALSKKFFDDLKKEDGLESLFPKINYSLDYNNRHTVNKRAIIAWMFKNWSRHYDMFI